MPFWYRHTPSFLKTCQWLLFIFRMKIQILLLASGRLMSVSITSSHTRFPSLESIMDMSTTSGPLHMLCTLPSALIPPLSAQRVDSHTVHWFWLYNDASHQMMVWECFSYPPDYKLLESKAVGVWLTVVSQTPSTMLHNRVCAQSVFQRSKWILFHFTVP